MVSQKLVSYVKKQLKAGYSVGEIKKAMSSAGHSSANINAAIAEAKGKAPAPAAGRAATGFVEVPVSFKIQTAKVPYVPRSSRLELIIIRPIWIFIMSIILTLYSIGYMIVITLFMFVAYILTALEWIKILILGKRWRAAFNWKNKFLTVLVRYSIKLNNYVFRRMPYILFMVDQRPPIGMEGEPDKEKTGSIA